MSKVCRQCGNSLSQEQDYCGQCGTLSRQGHVENLLDRWEIPEKIDSFKRVVGAVDVARLHILLSALAGLLVALPLALNILKAPSDGGTASVILRLFGQLVAATVVAYFPIGYLLRGKWPLFSRIEAHLGGPSSLLRVSVYALTLQLFLLIAFAELPDADGLADWTSIWLLGSVFWFFPVGFFLTGAVPFAGPLQRILGEDLSARRHLILSVSLTLPWWTSVSDIRQLLAVLALNFYLMGHATIWRSIGAIGVAIELPELQDRVTMVKDRVRERVENLRLNSLHTSEIDVTKTDIYSAGQSSVGEGYQLSFTLDRARVTLFLHNFGRDIFARTVVHCDVSGRRLWLMIGYLISFLDAMTVRWFGSSYLRYASQMRATLTPASRLRDRSYEPDPVGTYFASLFGLIEVLPDRDVNDLFALHGAIRHALFDALKEAMDSKGLDTEVESTVHRQLLAESMIERQSGASPIGSFQGLLPGKLA